MIKRLGLTVKYSNPEAIKTAADVADWAIKRGASSLTADPRLSSEVPSIEEVEPDKLAGMIDMMLVLGGDGTMLSAARLIDGRKVPILGVNLGGLGFLTALRVEEMFPVLERIFPGEPESEERMMLSVSLCKPTGAISEYTVLNDAIIKGSTARLVRMETRINKEYVTTYRADGLIVSTPTGSTAYSLSAAGPILYPTIHSIIVVPICPFNLTNRPVVIPDWMTVDIKVAPDQSGLVLILDGQLDVPLDSGDMVRIKRSEKSVYLVKYAGKSYFDILRERLMWEVKSCARQTES